MAEASEPVAPSEVDACTCAATARKRKLRSAKLDGSAFQEVCCRQAGWGVDMSFPTNGDPPPAFRLSYPSSTA